MDSRDVSRIACGQYLKRSSRISMFLPKGSVCQLCQVPVNANTYRNHLYSKEHSQSYLLQMSCHGPKHFYEKYGNVPFPDPDNWNPEDEEDPFMIFAMRCGFYSDFSCEACGWQGDSIEDYHSHIVCDAHWKRTHLRIKEIGENRYRLEHFSIPALAQERLFEGRSQYVFDEGRVMKKNDRNRSSRGIGRKRGHGNTDTHQSKSSRCERRESQEESLESKKYLKDRGTWMTITGLPIYYSEHSVRKLCSPYGEVTFVRFMPRKSEKQPKSARVRMKSEYDCIKFIKEYNNSQVGKGTIFVELVGNEFPSVKEASRQETESSSKELTINRKEYRGKTLLYISGLPVDYTDAKLEEMCSSQGNVISARMMSLKAGYKSRAGLVEMDTEESGQKVIQKHNQTILGEGLLIVKWADKQPGRDKDHSDPDHQNVPQWMESPPPPGHWSWNPEEREHFPPQQTLGGRSQPFMEPNWHGDGGPPFRPMLTMHPAAPHPPPPEIIHNRFFPPPPQNRSTEFFPIPENRPNEFLSPPVGSRTTEFPTPSESAPIDQQLLQQLNAFKQQQQMLQNEIAMQKQESPLVKTASDEPSQILKQIAELKQQQKVFKMQRQQIQEQIQKSAPSLFQPTKFEALSPEVTLPEQSTPSEVSPTDKMLMEARQKEEALLSEVQRREEEMRKMKEVAEIERRNAELKKKVELLELEKKRAEEEHQHSLQNQTLRYEEELAARSAQANQVAESLSQKSENLVHIFLSKMREVGVADLNLETFSVVMDAIAELSIRSLTLLIQLDPLLLEKFCIVNHDVLLGLASSLPQLDSVLKQINMDILIPLLRTVGAKAFLILAEACVQNPPLIDNLRNLLYNMTTKGQV